jgi:diguanylate cyclase (GGDEF)-like protein/PAS domain S-box-containing protein
VNDPHASPETILLIGNDPISAKDIRTTLQDPRNGSFTLIVVCTLSEGIDRLREGGIAAILLQLCLPDSSGLDTLNTIVRAATDVPVLILAENGTEALAIEAVSLGAQDYLLPCHLDPYSLPRALKNATERKSAEDQLFEERDRALVTLNSIGDAVLCTDVSGCITYLNTVAENLVGWRREDSIGLPLAKIFNIVDGATRKPAQDPLELAIKQNNTVGVTVNCVLIRRDGFEFAIEDSAAPIHDRSGKIIGAVIVFHDVTAARSLLLQMTYAAQHDLVTDLPNRLLLKDRISQAITLARRQQRPVGLLFLDLDHFKYINDALGHSVGDKLLQSVAKRLVSSLRTSDTVSRQGGDEFVILLPDITHPKDAAASASALLRSLCTPHNVCGQSLIICGSIGISVYPADGLDAETLIRNADTAMYHAKEAGRNDFQFFKESMNLKVVERLALERRIRRGIELKEFVLHYQPMVSMTTGELTGIEALIRWDSPDQGLVPPSGFVEVAEECGLIVEIGRWALRQACSQARAWQLAGLAALPISVNVSAVEFRNTHFIDEIRIILQETGLAARYLVLELTEGVLMEDIDSTCFLLQRLKDLGLSLAVDDFGTGFSSLSYLQMFPIDVLKIDLSFVREITPARTDSPILTAIINMGNSLKYRIVAEGVERQEQKEYLLAQHCEEGQGYLFSRPLTAVQFADLMQSHRCGKPSRFTQNPALLKGGSPPEDQDTQGDEVSMSL